MSKQKDYYQLEKTILQHKEKIDKLLEQQPIDKEEVCRLRALVARDWEKLKPQLTALHFVQIARHPKRPYTQDYLDYLTDDFLEFHGDRRAGDDPALITGFG